MKSKVLHLLPWVTSGGVERRRLILTKRLTQYDHTVFCTESSPGFRSAFHESGATLKTLGGSWGLLQLRSVAALWKRAHTMGPAIIHGAVFEGHTMAARLGALYHALPTRTRPKIIMEETGLPLTRSAKTKQLVRLLATFADACVAVSEPVYDHWRSIGVPREKLHLILNGVEVEPISSRDSLRAELGIAIDDIVVGGMARVHDHKHYDHILRSLAPLMRARCWRFVLIGEGPALDGLKSLVHELGIEHLVHFVGFQFNGRRLLPAFDVFVHHASESFGLVLIEALLAGVPLVAADMGAVRSVLSPLDESGARLVPPHDPDALRSACLAAVTDAAGEGTGRAFALKRYSGDAYAQRVADLYESLSC